MLAANVRVELPDNEQGRMWRSHQLRQNDGQRGEVAKLSPPQLVYSAMSTKAKLERFLGRTLGAEQTAIEWNKHVIMRSGSEKDEDRADGCHHDSLQQGHV